MAARRETFAGSDGFDDFAGFAFGFGLDFVVIFFALVFCFFLAIFSSIKNAYKPDN